MTAKPYTLDFSTGEKTVRKSFPDLLRERPTIFHGWGPKI
jgi:hypothetical protein